MKKFASALFAASVAFSASVPQAGAVGSISELFVASGSSYVLDGANLKDASVTDAKLVNISAAPSAKLEVANGGAFTARFGTTDNRTNATVQARGSIHAWAPNASSYAENGAADVNAYNNGSSPTFAAASNRARASASSLAISAQRLAASASGIFPHHLSAPAPSCARTQVVTQIDSSAPAAVPVPNAP